MRITHIRKVNEIYEVKLEETEVQQFQVSHAVKSNPANSMIGKQYTTGEVITSTATRKQLIEEFVEVSKEEAMTIYFAAKEAGTLHWTQKQKNGWVAEISAQFEGA